MSAEEVSELSFWKTEYVLVCLESFPRSRSGRGALFESVEESENDRGDAHVVLANAGMQEAARLISLRRA